MIDEQAKPDDTEVVRLLAELGVGTPEQGIQEVIRLRAREEAAEKEAKYNLHMEREMRSAAHEETARADAAERRAEEMLKVVRAVSAAEQPHPDIHIAVSPEAVDEVLAAEQERAAGWALDAAELVAHESRTDFAWKCKKLVRKIAATHTGVERGSDRVSDGVQLRDDHCRRYDNDGHCMCPNGRCYYDEQKERRARGELALTIEAWRAQLSARTERANTTDETSGG